MIEPLSNGRHIEYRSLLREDDLLDFREDRETVIRDAEASLVRFESGKGRVEAPDHPVFLSDRRRSSSEVIGLPWVDRLSAMLEDAERKVHAGAQAESVVNPVRAFCRVMEAQRKRLGQKDVDSLLGEPGR